MTIAFLILHICHFCSIFLLKFQDMCILRVFFFNIFLHELSRLCSKNISLFFFPTYFIHPYLLLFNHVLEPLCLQLSASTSVICITRSVTLCFGYTLIPMSQSCLTVSSAGESIEIIWEFQVCDFPDPALSKYKLHVRLL